MRKREESPLTSCPGSCGACPEAGGRPSACGREPWMGSTFALASLVVFLLPILSAALAVVSIPGDAPGRIAMAIPGFVLGAFLARLLVRRIPMQGKENDDDCAR